MKKKLSIILCVLMAAVFMFSACSSSSDTSSSSESASSEASESASAEATKEATEAPSEEASSEATEEASEEASTEASSSGKGGTFAIIAKSTGNPYNDKETEGFTKAIEEGGDNYKVIVRAPDQPTAEGQIDIIQELIAQGVDSITIAANDTDALQPVITQAREQGIAVSAVDSATNPESRQVFCNQAGTELIAQALMDAVYDMTGGEGEFAILSATSQATNQNSWIEAMQALMESDSKYEKLDLVKIAYGDDLRDKSVSETEALLQTYPDLKCIVAPTTVGIAAAGKVLTDKNLAGKVKLTGLGLPSEMAEYIKNDVCPYMFLWNPIDLGYLSGYTARALVDGEITGAVGDKFSAGDLGDYEVVDAADGGTEIILGPPFEFNPDNIDEWAEIY